MKDENRLKSLVPVLNLILVVILLLIFAVYTDFHKIIDVLTNTNLPIYGLSIVTNLLMMYPSSTRLWVILKKQGIGISIFKLALINLGIRFYSTFSPISSIGTLMRWNRVVPQGKSAEGLAVLAVNRILDVILAIGFGIFWAIGTISDAAIHPIGLVVYFIIFVLIVWGTLRSSRLVALWAQKKKTTASNTTKAWIYKGIEKLFHSLSLYSSLSGSEISIVLVTALFTELLAIIAHLITATSIGIRISFVDLGWIRALVFLAALTPLTLPGGFGIREVSMAVILSSFGIETEKAAAYSILLYARTLIIALIGGGIELFFNLTKLRNV